MSWKNREEWLHHFVKQARPIFAEKLGIEIPENVRVGVSWSARGGMRGKSIGECWTSAASKDGAVEIFVSPKLDDLMLLAGVMTHELVHATVGNDAKHGPRFKKACEKLGMEGKATTMVDGKAWRQWAGPIIDVMGAYPHASLTGGDTSAKPKQSTRMLKCTCDTCGFVFRTAKTWVEGAQTDEDGGEGLGLRCPDFRCEGVVVVDMPEGDD